MKARQIERPMKYYSTTSHAAVAAQLAAECTDVAHIEVVGLEKDEIRDTLKISYVTDMDKSLGSLHFMPVIEGEVIVEISGDVSEASQDLSAINNHLISPITDEQVVVRVRFDFRAPFYDLSSLKANNFEQFQTEFVLPVENDTYTLKIMGVENMRRTVFGTTFTGIGTLVKNGDPKNETPAMLTSSSLNPTGQFPALVLSMQGVIITKLHAIPRWVIEQ